MNGKEIAHGETLKDTPEGEQIFTFESLNTYFTFGRFPYVDNLKKAWCVDFDYVHFTTTQDIMLHGFSLYGVIDPKK
jgi:hypothetical protein